VEESEKATIDAREPADSGAPRAGPPLVSIVAIALSICALLVSVFEVSAIRDETRFQVWPFLSLGTSYSADGFRIVIENKGVGPAKIRSVDYSFDGEQLDADSPGEMFNALIRKTLGEEDSFDYSLYRMSDPEGGVMSADEATDLFAVPWEESSDRIQRLANSWQEQLFVTVCYCSVYEDCWLAELNGGEPAEIDRCSAR
jgi:hypothetical protein